MKNIEGHRILILVLVIPLLTVAALGLPRGEASAGGAKTTSVLNTLAGVSITVEGRVGAFVKATATSNGSITIAGITYRIKAGVKLCDCIKVGAQVRLRLSLNLLGLISGCTVDWVKINVSGLVSAYVAATSTKNGSITIGGHTYVVKAGVSLPNCVRIGAYVALNLKLNGSGSVTSCTFLNAWVTVSGLVTAYVRATASANGSITIGGHTYVIKAGTSLPSCVRIGVNLKLRLILNAGGLVKGCNVLQIISGLVTLEGLVTAYVKPTATTKGSITIGGIRLGIKAGVSLPAAIAVGVRLRLTLDVKSGSIAACQFVSASVKVSGLLALYLPATASKNGSIKVGTNSFVIKAGTTLPLLSIGLFVNLTLRLNSAGQVIGCSC